MILISGQHILLATRAKQWHSSLDAPLKDVHSRLHPCASIPDGPADPVIFIAAVRMTLASSDSKITGCTSWGGDWRMQLAQAVWPIGCLLSSTSRTVGESVVLGSVWSSRCKMPLSPVFERRSRAALHFPANIRLAMDRAIFAVDFDVRVFGSLP